MKIIPFLIACFFFANHSKAQDTCLLPMRYVFPEAVTLWQNMYDQVKEMGPFKNTSGYDRVSFNPDSLNRLYDQSALGNSSCRVILIRYYLDEDTIPKLALANEEDTSRFLIYQEDSSNVFRTYAELQDGFNKWKDFFTKNNPEEGGAPYVWVKMYRYNWSAVHLILGEDRTNNLQIENVAHTISSENTLYELPGMSNKNEGYIAFDILIWKNSEAIANTVDDYDFVMPCPRNCPTR